MPSAISPHLSPLQAQLTSSGKHPPVPAVCAVTGGTGFVGARLVEMLVERGAKEVRCLDIVPPPKNSWRDPRITYIVGDICDRATVDKLVTGAGCVWHNAAVVGPFHPKPLYEKVNYEGTLNVIAACKAAGVRKIVMSSSPSTRFDGQDVDGLTEAEMPSLPQEKYLQVYAETKAMGEVAMTQACCDELMTCAVAPHQVYGPRDNLFLPNLLEAAGTGRLRVFGAGRNRIWCAASPAPPDEMALKRAAAAVRCRRHLRRPMPPPPAPSDAAAAAAAVRCRLDRGIHCCPHPIYMHRLRRTPCAPSS